MEIRENPQDKTKKISIGHVVLTAVKGIVTIGESLGIISPNKNADQKHPEKKKLDKKEGHTHNQD